VESEVKLLWQYPSRLHRIGTHHFQQEAFHANAVILELLRIAQQQFLGHASEQLINALSLVFGWH
jgi:hypothetical protein